MMFGTRTRKILREVASHKARTVLVALNIFIGVLGVVTLTSVSDLMIRTTQKDLHEDELPMVYMNVTLEDYSAIDNAETLATLRAHPGATVVEGWLGDHLFWRSPEDQGFIDGIILASSEPLGQIKINPEAPLIPTTRRCLGCISSILPGSSHHTLVPQWMAMVLSMMRRKPTRTNPTSAKRAASCSARKKFSVESGR